MPVEYKHGQPKGNNADRIQLCLQAMCLEESLLCEITKGYLYYGKTKHRTEVLFDESLRGEGIALLREMHELYHRKHTPLVKPSNKCRSCSLNTICMPKILRNKNVNSYINKHIKEVP